MGVATRDRTSREVGARPPDDQSDGRPDAALLAAARSDPTGEAFRAFHDRHAGALLRFLLGMVRERALAEDLLQDAFFRAYQHLDRYDPSRPAWPWLLSIARNAAISALRSRKKGAEVADRPGSDRVPRLAAHAEMSEAARAALASLQDEERALLLQRHGLGLKLDALAHGWGCTERTIRNRLHAAADSLLRALLERAPRAGAASEPVAITRVPPPDSTGGPSSPTSTAPTSPTDSGDRS